MKELPTIFTAENVLAIRAGRKTQTRRLAEFVGLPGSGYNPDFTGYSLGEHSPGKWTLSSRGAGSCWNERTEPLKLPYGVGDRLWIQESYRVDCQESLKNRVSGVYLADGVEFHITLTDKEYSKWFNRRHPHRSTPGRFMYRSLSRTLLEVTALRVERLQDISADDCRAEGHPPYQGPGELSQEAKDDAARDWYMDLWESINGPGSWAKNPWVRVVNFKDITPTKN